MLESAPDLVVERRGTRNKLSLIARVFGIDHAPLVPDFVGFAIGTAWYSGEIDRGVLCILWNDSSVITRVFGVKMAVKIGQKRGKNGKTGIIR